MWIIYQFKESQPVKLANKEKQLQHDTQNN